MKIHKELLINGESVQIVNDHIRLELNTPGRALLTVTNLSQVPLPGQLLELNARLDSNDWRRVFYGYIESVTAIKPGVYQLLARELAAALNRRVTLNLRHCLPTDVLSEVSLITGLEFVLPDQSWTNQTIARFQHVGGGYMALDCVLSLWSVERGVWHQQSDGRVYLGEWKYSVSGQRCIDLPVNVFSDHSLTGGTLPLVPRLKPGVSITHTGKKWVVTSVEISGVTMRLQWIQIHDVWKYDLTRVQ